MTFTSKFLLRFTHQLRGKADVDFLVLIFLWSSLVNCNMFFAVEAFKILESVGVSQLELENLLCLLNTVDLYPINGLLLFRFQHIFSQRGLSFDLSDKLISLSTQISLNLPLTKPPTEVETNFITQFSRSWNDDEEFLKFLTNSSNVNLVNLVDFYGKVAAFCLFLKLHSLEVDAKVQDGITSLHSIKKAGLLPSVFESEFESLK
ncbi:hypothetical protein P9112_004086 [Eukaryota sp. TZLM1-RC]